MFLHSTLPSIIISIYFLSFCFARHGEFITKHDRPYSVLNIKVPSAVWHQALNPTPVFKSAVTVTVPIHVAAEEENEVEDVVNDGTEVSVAVDSTLINDEPISSVSADTEVTVSPAGTVTQSPVLQDGLPEQPVQGVTGQVTRFPCTCNDGQCGCCTGAIMDRFRMKACGNISFVPQDFVFDVRLTLNNNTVVRRRVSASDPPPICFNPRRAPFVRVCAEISNIRIRNGNAFACLDIKADIGSFPVYSASFRCFGLGSSGLQTGLKPKPVSSGPKPVNLFGSGSTNNDGTILDAAGQLLTGGNNGNGLFGAPQGGLFGGGGGPLDAIGDAVGNLLE
ncbi:jg21531 [Pararge aegeria aegeria]|uniref:Jg21531 protein n=1 Tax=Pararge aegeria aegeria TaxID=348720 RepID=A0A8S4RPC9_9NEOP|nr:jg21531 [Pararge aegeria aegeria]